MLCKTTKRIGRGDGRSNDKQRQGQTQNCERQKGAYSTTKELAVCMRAQTQKFEGKKRLVVAAALTVAGSSSQLSTYHTTVQLRCSCELRACKTPGYTGSRVHAPTATALGDLLALQTSVSTHPKGSRWHAPTAALTNCLQLSAACVHVHSSQGHPFARAHCSTTRWPPRAAPLHTFSSQGQPFACAHCSTAKWTPRAESLQVHTSFWSK